MSEKQKFNSIDMSENKTAKTKKGGETDTEVDNPMSRQSPFLNRLQGDKVTKVDFSDIHSSARELAVKEKEAFLLPDIKNSGRDSFT